MAEIYIVGKKVGSSELLQGAAIGAGAAFIAMGIKKFFDARAIRFEEEYFEDADAECDVALVEEYRIDRVEKLRRKHRCAVSSGVFGVALGSLLAAAGIISFTPLKKYFDAETLTNDIKDKFNSIDLKDKLEAINLKNKLEAIDLKDKLEAINFKSKLDTIDLKDKIDAINLKNKLDEIDLKNKINEIDIKNKLDDIDLRDKFDELNIKNRLNDLDIKDKIDSKKIKEKIDAIKLLDTVSKFGDLINYLKENI